MYKIAVIDDEWESVERLIHCFDTYTKEYGVRFNVSRFSNGLEFIEEYRPIFDIVFMDIDMPHKNGLAAAMELRKVDPAVELVFVTFLAKYAIKGYEVGAIDYVLKPVNYNAFKITIGRAIRKCMEKGQKEVLLPSSEGTIRMQLSDLNYVEIVNHDITYHTSRGAFRVYGTMRAIEKLLPEKQFIKCNRSTLVNLRNVTRINNDFVYIGNEQLEISRTRKKAFLDAFHVFNFPSGV